MRSGCAAHSIVSVEPVESVTVALYSSKIMPAKGKRRRVSSRSGWAPVEDPVHVSDFHATLLSLLGLDNMRLTYLHKNRPERPTLNEGSPCEKIVNG